eukprot:4383313-Prymnesium_polylepis.1
MGGNHVRRLPCDHALCALLAVSSLVKARKRTRTLCLRAVSLVCSVAFATSRDQNSPPRWHLCPLRADREQLWRVRGVVSTETRIEKMYQFLTVSRREGK